MSDEVLTKKVWLSSNPEPPDGQTSDLTTPPPNWFTSEPPKVAAELYGLEYVPRLLWGNADTKQISVTVLDTQGFRRMFQVNVRRFTDYNAKVHEIAAPTTHVLRFGRALCGRKGVPASWPPGNRWVSFEDASNLSRVSCPECLVETSRT